MTGLFQMKLIVRLYGIPSSGNSSSSSVPRPVEGLLHGHNELRNVRQVLKLLCCEWRPYYVESSSHV